MKNFNKHEFSPIKGEKNIQPARLFRITPLFGPLTMAGLLNLYPKYAKLLGLLDFLALA